MSRDLVVLVADVQQEASLDMLLKMRQGSLGIHPITFSIFRHPGKDSGVYHSPEAVLEPVQRQYAHALAVVDQEWDGVPGNATHVRQALVQRLEGLGWPPGACEAIVIEPELEAWIWSGSNHVPAILRTTWPEIRELARLHGYWVDGEAKPHKPKDLLEAILKQQRRPRSSAIFEDIAQKVGVKHCHDPAFMMLHETLSRWFAV